MNETLEEKVEATAECAGAVKDLADDIKTTESTPFGKILAILLRAVETKLPDAQKLFEELNSRINRVRQPDGTEIDDRLEEVKLIESTVEKHVRERTLRLLDLVRNAERGHITFPAGTDFTFGLGEGAGSVPVLGIIPLYGEVAVMPVLETTSGVFVIDGPTQRGIRPADELDREPLRITVEEGRMVEVTGPPAQMKWLEAFIASGDPPADAVDEVGILTTTLEENDRYYWSDGTHHHDRVHIALGNNVRRDVVVHGPKHADTEVDKPTISIDRRVVVEDGVWLR